VFAPFPHILIVSSVGGTSQPYNRPGASLYDMSLFGVIGQSGSSSSWRFSLIDKHSGEQSPSRGGRRFFTSFRDTPQSVAIGRRWRQRRTSTRYQHGSEAASNRGYTLWSHKKSKFGFKESACADGIVITNHGMGKRRIFGSAFAQMDRGKGDVRQRWSSCTSTRCTTPF